MWCFQQGYVKAEDRAILTNWLLNDESTLHVDDLALKPHLLAMADEVLDALARCSIEDCDETVVARGLCSRHYKQWQRQHI